MTNEAHDTIAGTVADRFREDAARLGATPADLKMIESAAYLAALSALEHAERTPAALFRAGRVYRTGLARYPERTDLAAHERAAFRDGAAWQADQIAQADNPITRNEPETVPVPAHLIREAADWLIDHADSDVEDCEACVVYAEGGGNGYCPVHHGFAEGVDATLAAVREREGADDD